MTDHRDRDLEEGTLDGIVGGAGVSVTKPKTDDWVSGHGGGDASLPSLPPHPTNQLLAMEIAAEQKMHDMLGGHPGADTHHGKDGAAEQKSHDGEPKAETAEQKLHDAEQKLHGIGEKTHGVDQKSHDGDLKGQTAEQKLHDAELKLHDIGDKAHDAEHKRPDADLKAFEAQEKRVHEMEAALSKQHDKGIDSLGQLKGHEPDGKMHGAPAGHGSDPGKPHEPDATSLQANVAAIQAELRELDVDRADMMKAILKT